MVSQSWIIDCLKMYKTVIKFIENTMETGEWNLEQDEKVS